MLKYENYWDKTNMKTTKSQFVTDHVTLCTDSQVYLFSYFLLLSYAYMTCNN